jgi:DNA-directed RNA polymerase subunit RPC12/RpoP
MKTLDMFSLDGTKPRRAPRVMMHVAEAGQGNSGKVIQFVCSKCGHDTGWFGDEKSISENKRGIPCPLCN